MTNEEATTIIKNTHGERKLRIIVVKQTNGKFVFTAPDGVDIAPGDTLVCSTRYGEQPAVALSPAYDVAEEHVDGVLNAFGTERKNMKPIIGRLTVEYFGEAEK